MAAILGTPNSEFLPGTTGSDTILAFEGNDTILGLDGDDLMDGNPGNDVLDGNIGNDTVYGGQDNDVVRGGQQNDSLFGDKGSDTLYGELGDDTLYGGTDNDFLFGDQDQSTGFSGSGNDVLFGNEGNDTLLGLAGNDLLFGNEDNDLLDGNMGNDTLYGGQGNDTVRGGMQNDSLFGDKGNDVLFGDLGDDTLFGGIDNDLLVGDQGPEANFGGKGNDILYGNEGNDTLLGLDGNDLLFGNQDNDLLDGNMGNDTVYGGQGSDTVRGGMQNDSLFGDKGNDVLFGDLGDDTLFGGTENDLLVGDQGPEANLGGKGNDILYGNEGNDTLLGLDGNDLLFGNEDNDLLNGNLGNDTVYGGQGNDTVWGGQGNDSLFGDKGNDVLFGDLGADTLTGNAGDALSDIFVVGRVTGATTKTTGGPTIADADVVTDFQPCIDFISLSGGVTYDDLSIFQGTGANAKDTIIQDKGTGEFLAVLLGISSDSIDGSSFIPAGPPTVRIAATDALAAEPTVGNPIDTGEFTISVVCAPEEDLPVVYTISGTAENGIDYNPLIGVAIIPEGSHSTTISVIPLLDTLTGEGPETVTLTLTDLPAYNVAAPNNTATVTISEGPVVPITKPTVSVSAIDPNASEQGGDTGTFQFARTGGDITKDIIINYTITGTATPSKDYTSLTGTITIPAGQTVSTPVIVTPSGDSLNEPTEAVVVTVAEDPAYTVGAQDTAAVRILDNNPLTGTPANAGPILRYNSGGAFQSSHADFSAAIAAASNNDIIVALAGTYPGNVIINKPLTLRGPNAGITPSLGSSPAIVQASLNQPVFTILPGVNNVTIEGLRIQMGGDNSNAIRLQGASDNLIIRQNEFTGSGPATGGVIFLDANGAASSVEVIDNLIRDVNSAADTSGIQIFRFGGNVRVSDNTIANLTGPGIAADAITGSSNLIGNNTIDEIEEQGIQLAGGNATISNNDITNANTDNGQDRGGIRLRDSGLNGTTLGTVNVLSNTIINSFNGVAVRDGTTVPNTVAINFNNLLGNTNAGLYHGGTGALNARENWWDNPAGPVPGSGGPNGILGASADQVDFDEFSQVPFS